MPKKKRTERLIWDDCICPSLGSDRTVHTIECKRNHRRLYINRIHRDIRKERKEEHLCCSCGAGVKPKLVYPNQCKKCEHITKEYNNKRKNKNENNIN